MRTSFIKRMLVLILVLVFNYFFWSERLGINLLIFCVFLFASLVLFNRKSFSSLHVIILTCSTLVLGGLVVYNNTLLSKCMFFIFFVTALGYIHLPQLRSISFAFPTAVLNFFMFPYTWGKEMKEIFKGSKKISGAFRWVKLIVVPLLIIIIFYAIYINANPIFAEASDYVWAKFDDVFWQIFRDFPLVRLLFIFLGLVIVTGFLYNSNIDFLALKESQFKNELTRHYNPFGLYRSRFKALGLINEKRSAIILLVLVNLLIAILNYIDIRYVWFGFEYYKGFDIRQFVHEGTYLLILSILLSMGIMLFYFRRNLNFYTGNVWMKRLSYMWILQNGIMAVSVGVRNYYYIYYSHILAYKRIGLIMFLIMVFAGLVTLYLKINRKWTIYRLIKVNLVSVYTVLFISSFFNWGPIIAEYNLANPDKDAIEYEFIVELSNETLPILDRHKDLLDRELIFYDGLRRMKINGLTYYYEKKNQFIVDYEGDSWLSWNYTDWKTYEYFKDRKFLID
ncbi:MAG: DUF4173 domain-containing protein [Ignavibacteriae bacterium]|nr:DUF4173 domain-containing protein [Ignavibacteriota bacterium]